MRKINDVSINQHEFAVHMAGGKNCIFHSSIFNIFYLFWAFSFWINYLLGLVLN